MLETVIKQIEKKLVAAGLLPLRAQAELSTAILKERLETTLPWAMEEAGFDFWIIAARENCMDPILKTLYPWDMIDVGRSGILAFHLNRETGRVRRMVIGRGSPEMASVYERVQEPDEDIWQAIGRVVAECKPDKIAINRSKVDGFCDGLSSTMYEELQEALKEQAVRLSDAEELTLRWLQRVSPLEKKIMKVLAEMTHDIISYAFSPQVIRVGETTTTDVEWFMRDVINRLGFLYWFGPDVNLQRKGSGNSLMVNEVIHPGDLVHCDIGLKGTYIQLHTDMQWMAYVRQAEESEAPGELRDLFVKGKRLQDIVREKMEGSPTGNDAFFASLETAQAEELQVMIYTHPIGTFGHGAGPSIGRYDLQGFVPVMGERMIRDQTCYALELNVSDRIEAWDNQLVYMYLEEDICKDGGADGTVNFINGRQEELLLI
jgi:hypothetical protein